MQTNKQTKQQTNQPKQTPNPHQFVLGHSYKILSQEVPAISPQELLRHMYIYTYTYVYIYAHTRTYMYCSFMVLFQTYISFPELQ